MRLIEKASLGFTGDHGNSSRGKGKGWRRLLSQSSQVLRVWTDFLAADVLPHGGSAAQRDEDQDQDGGEDEGRWGAAGDLRSLLSSFLRATLTLEEEGNEEAKEVDNGNEWEKGVKREFCVCLSSLIGLLLRKRKLLFANVISEGPTIGVHGRIDLQAVYWAILEALEVPAAAEEADCDPEGGQGGGEGRQGASPKGKRARKNNSRVEKRIGSRKGNTFQSSEASSPFFYEDFFAGRVAFKLDATLTLRALRLTVGNAISDSDFALFLLKAITDILTGLDDLEGSGSEEYRWRDACNFFGESVVADLFRSALSGGLVRKGSNNAGREPAANAKSIIDDGYVKSPLAELKLMVASFER